MDLIKVKKASLIIAILDFILGIGVFVLSFCYLYFQKEDAFNFQTFSTYVQDFIKAANYKSINTYVWFLFSAGPLLFGLIGLFGRLGRLPNILSFGAMFFSLTFALTYTLDGNAGKSVVDFASGNSITCFSISLIVLFVGVILSFVNLEKSK
ncbi:MAG: hypothetical protein LKJ88_06770 [Bacilli bacterium]|jgi:hypothetical protein|nr:hypothetical protein [Bacilli bacterium]